MKNIEWKTTEDCSVANIGNIMLLCDRPVPNNKRIKCKSWRCRIYMRSGLIKTKVRFGPVRRSLNKSQQDAIRIVKQLLLDCHKYILTEMANFDIE